jgi:hypothetical protein
VFLTMDRILKILFVQREHFKGLDKSVFGITKNVALSVKNANLSRSAQSVMDHTKRQIQILAPQLFLALSCYQGN